MDQDFASSVVDGRLRTRHLFILMHNGGESKRSGRCEINIKSDVKIIRKEAEQDFENALNLFHKRWFSSSDNELKAQKQNSC